MGHKELVETGNRTDLWSLKKVTPQESFFLRFVKYLRKQLFPNQKQQVGSVTELTFWHVRDEAKNPSRFFYLFAPILTHLVVPRIAIRPISTIKAPIPE